MHYFPWEQYISPQRENCVCEPPNPLVIPDARLISRVYNVSCVRYLVSACRWKYRCAHSIREGPEMLTSITNPPLCSLPLIHPPFVCRKLHRIHSFHGECGNTEIIHPPPMLTNIRPLASKESKCHRVG